MKKSTLAHVTLAALLSAAMGLSHAESNGAMSNANNSDGGAAANPVSETTKPMHKAKKHKAKKHKMSSDHAMSGNLDDSQPTAAGTTAPMTTPMPMDKTPRDTNEPTGRYRPDNGTGASAPGTARTDR